MTQSLSFYYPVHFASNVHHMAMSWFIIGTAVINFSFPSVAFSQQNNQQQKNILHVTPEEFQWKNRLLLIKTASETSTTLLNEWQSEFKHELADRKLLIFKHNGNNSWSAWKNSAVQQLHSDKLPLNLCNDCFYLVGLDGGIKLSSTLTPLNLDELFTIIDGMPMRRAELVEREQGKN